MGGAQSASKMATAQWMWGDANLLGHTIAQKNPMRWSSKQSIEDVIGDLERCEARGLQRSVLICLNKSGAIDERRYESVTDAIAQLKEMMQCESGTDSVPPDAQCTGADASSQGPVEQGTQLYSQEQAPLGSGTEDAPADDGTLLSDDGIMQLLRAGGQEALLGQWLQQVIVLVSLRSDLLGAETCCDDRENLEAYKGFHTSFNRH